MSVQPCLGLLNIHLYASCACYFRWWHTKHTVSLIWRKRSATVRTYPATIYSSLAILKTLLLMRLETCRRTKFKMAVCARGRKVNPHIEHLAISTSLSVGKTVHFSRRILVTLQNHQQSDRRHLDIPNPDITVPTALYLTFTCTPLHSSGISQANPAITGYVRLCAIHLCFHTHQAPAISNAFSILSGSLSSRHKRTNHLGLASTALPLYWDIPYSVIRTLARFLRVKKMSPRLSLAIHFSPTRSSAFISDIWVSVSRGNFRHANLKNMKLHAARLSVYREVPSDAFTEYNIPSLVIDHNLSLKGTRKPVSILSISCSKVGYLSFLIIPPLFHCL